MRTKGSETRSAIGKVGILAKSLYDGECRMLSAIWFYALCVSNEAFKDVKISARNLMISRFRSFFRQWATFQRNVLKLPSFKIANFSFKVNRDQDQALHLPQATTPSIGNLWTQFFNLRPFCQGKQTAMHTAMKVLVSNLHGLQEFNWLLAIWPHHRSFLLLVGTKGQATTTVVRIWQRSPAEVSGSGLRSSSSIDCWLATPRSGREVSSSLTVCPSSLPEVAPPFRLAVWRPQLATLAF